MNSTRIRKTAIGRHLLYSLWRDQRIAAAIATAAALLLGLAVTYVMPHSPATATQALIVMVTSFAVGSVAGLVNLVENVNVLRGLLDMFAVMYPQLQNIDFRKTVKQLEVPVYLLDGAAELKGRRDLALDTYLKP